MLPPCGYYVICKFSLEGYVLVYQKLIFKHSVASHLSEFKREFKILLTCKFIMSMYNCVTIDPMRSQPLRLYFLTLLIFSFLWGTQSNNEISLTRFVFGFIVAITLKSHSQRVWSHCITDVWMLLSHLWILFYLNDGRTFTFYHF